MKHKLLSRATMYILFFCGAMVLSACSSLDQTITTSGAEITTTTQESSGVIAEGNIIPQDHASLFFPISGEVLEILVQEGDLVAQGDLLARLGDRETLEAHRSSAELERIIAQQDLDDLQQKSTLAFSQAWVDLVDAEAMYITAEENLSEIDTEIYHEKIDDARNEVVEAYSVLEEAQEEFEKYKDLDENAYNRTRSEDKLEEAQDKYDEAVRKRDRLVNSLAQATAALKFATERLEDARRTYEARAGGPDPDVLALAQARLDNAHAQLSAIDADLKKMDLIAPFGGTIITVDISAGERVLPNQIVMLIADLSQWYVETSDLSEYDVVSISPDQIARIIPDALPEVSMSAKVGTISQMFTEKSGDINYRTKLLLVDTHPLLRWGMTVEIKFDLRNP